MWPVSWVPLFIIFFFWPCHASCRILVTRPGIKLGDLTVRSPSPNHWSARESPMFNFKSIVSSIFSQTTEFIALLRCLFTSPLLSLSDCERKSHTKSYSWNSLKLLFCSSLWKFFRTKNDREGPESEIDWHCPLLTVLINIQDLCL